MITETQFSTMISSNQSPNLWYPIAVDFFRSYDINTTNRIAGFMAQCGHESGDFRNIEENMNYTWQRLREVFSAFFLSDAKAKNFHRQPEKIANYVYDDRNPARRNKLGNVRDGDGWKFRGSGLIHLTGRFNYTRFGASIGLTAEQAADYTRTRRGAFESACWFWKVNNINRFCDSDNIRGMSVVINGGLNGLDDRINRYDHNKALLVRGTELKVGSRGELVRLIQYKLGITADNFFGPQTKRAVESWQRINRYKINGILNQDQINKILSN